MKMILGLFSFILFLTLSPKQAQAEDDNLPDHLIPCHSFFSLNSDRIQYRANVHEYLKLDQKIYSDLLIVIAGGPMPEVYALTANSKKDQDSKTIVTLTTGWVDKKGKGTREPFEKTATLTESEFKPIQQALEKLVMGTSYPKTGDYQGVLTTGPGTTVIMLTDEGLFSGKIPPYRPDRKPSMTALSYIINSLMSLCWDGAFTEETEKRIQEAVNTINQAE